MVTFVLVLLAQTILNFLLKGSTGIGQTVLTTVYDTFSNVNGNPYNNIMGLVPAVELLKIPEIVFGLAYAIIFMLFFVEIYRAYIAQLTGQNSDNPILVVGRTIVAVALIVFFYQGANGILNASQTGFLSTLAKIFQIPFDFQVSEGVTLLEQIKAYGDEAGSFGIDVTLPNLADISAYAGIFIISGGILGGVVSAAISVLERCITLAMYIILGPICLAFYTSKATASAAGEWIKGLFIQYLVVMFSLIMWGIASYQMSIFLEAISGSGVFDTAANNALRDGISTGAITIVLFSICGNFEEIFGSLGFRMMSGLDSARLVGGGLQTALSSIRTAAMVGAPIANAISNSEAGKKVGNALGDAGKSVAGFSKNMAGNMAEKAYSAVPQSVRDSLSSVGSKIKGNVDTATTAARKANSAFNPTKSFASNTPVGDKKAYTTGNSPTANNASNMAYNASQTLGKGRGDMPYGGDASIATSKDTQREALDNFNKFNSHVTPTLTGAASSTSAGVLSQVADLSEDHLTDAEKNQKATAISTCFSQSQPGFYTKATYSDGTQGQVLVGRGIDGNYAITSGGADVSQIKSITNGDGKEMAITPQDTYAKYDFNRINDQTADSSGAQECISLRDANGEYIGGVSAGTVMSFTPTNEGDVPVLPSGENWKPISADEESFTLDDRSMREYIPNSEGYLTGPHITSDGTMSSGITTMDSTSDVISGSESYTPSESSRIYEDTSNQTDNFSTPSTETSNFVNLPHDESYDSYAHGNSDYMNDIIDSYNQDAPIDYHGEIEVNATPIINPSLYDEENWKNMQENIPSDLNEVMNYPQEDQYLNLEDIIPTEENRSIINHYDNKKNSKNGGLNNDSEIEE